MLTVFFFVTAHIQHTPHITSRAEVWITDNIIQWETEYKTLMRLRLTILYNLFMIIHEIVCQCFFLLPMMLTRMCSQNRVYLPFTKINFKQHFFLWCKYCFDIDDIFLFTCWVNIKIGQLDRNFYITQHMVSGITLLVKIW